MKKFPNNFFKKTTPILVGVGLLISAIILSGLFFNKSEKKTEQAIDFYKEQFSAIFSEENNLTFDKPAPILVPILGADNEIDHYQAENSSFTAIIPATNYQAPLIFERKGYQLSIAPKKAEDKSAYYKENSLFPTAHAQKSEPVYYLIYKDVYQSVDVVKKMQPNGVKEAIVLKSEKAPREFEFNLNISALLRSEASDAEAKKESDGSIRFYKKIENPEAPRNINGLVLTEPDNFLFRIPAPFMLDAKRTKSNKCQWKLSQISNAYYELTLICDTSGLSYPIAIDPSVSDTYDDESKVAAKSNTEVTGGQVKLTQTSGWLSGWTYRKKIIISTTNVDADLTYFPAYVPIVDDTQIGAAALSTGYDIRFTSSNGTTLLSYERLNFAIAGGEADGDFYVRVLSISGTADTDIYLYYGKSDAPDVSSHEDAFQAADGWAGVWHLEESVEPYLDATSNNNDSAGSTDPERVAGKTGYGQDFDSANSEFIMVADNASLDFNNTDDWTATAWVRMETLQDRLVVGKVGAGYVYWALSMLFDTPVCRTKAEFGDGANFKSATSYDNGMAVSTWYHVAGRMDENNSEGINIWTSGVKSTSYNDPTTVGSMVNSAPVIIGASDEYGTSPFNGMMDEIRVFKGLLSDAWIKFEYYNSHDSHAAGNEITWGNQEGGYSSSGTLTSTNLLTGQAVNSISSFYYNASSIPAGTNLEVQFSQDNTNWYSASGSADWTSCDTTSGESISLSGLGWSGANFYYKFQFNSNAAQTSTPVVDDIRVDYAANIGVRIKGGTRLKGGVRIK